MASLTELLKNLTPEQQHYIARLVASLPESEGGLGLPLRNTPEQRAKQLNYSLPVYHATTGDIASFDVERSSPSAAFGKGVYTELNPISAGKWAKTSEGANVLPLLADVSKVLPMQELSAHDAKILSKYLGRDIEPSAAVPYFSLEKRGGSVSEGAKLAGFSGVEHAGPGGHGTNIVFSDPSTLRSKFAAFNPWRKNESDLLASHPLASAGAALAATGGLSGMAREYLNKPYDPANQYAQYGLTPPMTRGEALKSAIGSVPGVGDVLAGAEALQAAGEGKWGEAGLNALGAAGMIPAGGIAGAIKASHGSPHAHTKFDFSKIGTGEGAQAYGHGGYFAQGFDSPVAQEYAKNLANINQATGLQTAHANAKNQVARFGNDPEWAAEVVADTMRNYDPKDAQYAALADTLKFIKSGDYAKPLQDEGYLYNVELKWPNAAKETADPLGEHHLLDWDAPYQQQPSHIQELLKNYYSDVVNKRTNIREGLQAKFAAQGKVAPIREEMSPVTGQQLYDQIASQLNSRELASNYLAEKGIPGIRYLDQGSRGYSEVFNVGAPVDNFGPYTPYYTQAAADEALKELQKYFPNAEIRKHSNPQTRNYVMFDERFPNIVSRNGVSLVDLLRK